MIEANVVNINQYELKGTGAEFTAAISGLAARTETEGHPGVETYYWYLDEAAGTAGAVIVYADAAAWLAHHEMAYEWPEMPALQATVALRSLTVFGPLSPAVDAWLAKAGLSFTHYPVWTAGFGR